jgi:hypothetical protein
MYKNYIVLRINHSILLIFYIIKLDESKSLFIIVTCILLFKRHVFLFFIFVLIFQHINVTRILLFKQHVFFIFAFCIFKKYFNNNIRRYPVTN